MIDSRSGSQHWMIADLDRDGHDTTQALLATYRLTQAEHIAHRNRILKMLQQRNGSSAIFRPGHIERDVEQEPARGDGPKAFSSEVGTGSREESAQKNRL